MVHPRRARWSASRNLALPLLIFCAVARPAAAQDAPDPAECVAMIGLSIEAAAIPADQIGDYETALQAFRSEAESAYGGSNGADEQIIAQTDALQSLDTDSLRDGAENCLQQAP